MLLTNIDENELIQLLQSRSEKGFDYLYTNYSGALFGVITKLIPQQEIAEDVLQEAFVKIWNNIAQYDANKGRLFTWMLNITRNLAIDTLRSKAMGKFTQNQTIDNSVDSIDMQYQTNMQTDTIGMKNLVAKLPDEHRVVIELMYFKGYTQAEIAEEFNIPLGTVKTRARNAITKLRELFGLHLTAKTS